MALSVQNPMFPNQQLPSPEPSDSARVVQCLLAAHAHWQEGQLREAVRAVQRGAEAAEEDGNDLRALSLARAAADLSAQVGGSVPVSGAHNELVAPTALDVAAPEPEVSSEATERSAVRSSPTASSPQSSPSSATASSPQSSPSSLRSSPTASSPEGEPPPASAPDAAMAPSGARSASPSRRPAQPLSGLSKRVSRPPALSGDLQDGPALSGELRVSVKRSSLDPALFIVRPLAPSAPVPPGAREARLVFEPDGDSTPDTK